MYPAVMSWKGEPEGPGGMLMFAKGPLFIVELGPHDTNRSQSLSTFELHPRQLALPAVIYR